MMKSLDLSLRQKKLLHTMQHSSAPRTSFDLAEELGVSSRTIRSDVGKINEELSSYGACIQSLKSKGYLFHAEDPHLIESLNQVGNAFFSKENRVRYLAFRLCLADEPLNLYDLEEEMFISHTTLEHAIRDFLLLYGEETPNIRLNRKRDFIELEKDELKRRAVLNRLLRESWNYHARHNAYYKDDFIDDDILDFIIDTLSFTLDKYDIKMEDPCIVSLNLILAIMYYRILDGHFLAYAPRIPRPDPVISAATDELLDQMEKHLQVFIGPEERDAIYLQIASHRVITVADIDPDHVDIHFGPVTIEMTNGYIHKIRDELNIDFSDDADFYITLLQYFQTLLQGHNTFYEQFNADIIKRDLRIDMVIAYLFQPLAIRYMGKPLSEVKLIYLAYIIAGGLDHFIKHHPENKIRTVIACHMNMPVNWALKRKALYHFGSYLDVVDLVPVYKKNSYDFTNIDLVLTTVQKKITDNPGTTTLYISQFFDGTDHDELAHYIMTRTLTPMYSKDVSLHNLLRNAWWHENQTFKDPNQLLHRVTQQFLDAGIADKSFQEDILHHEKTTTYAVFPGIVLIYSLLPARKSQISITTLDHRITWNSNKIRIVVTTAFTAEDMPAILRLTNFLYEDGYDADGIKHLKTKEEIITYIRNTPQLLLKRD
jgi:lichenan operon transcriptional antiterminator